MNKVASASLSRGYLMAAVVLGIILLILGGSLAESSEGFPVVYWASNPVYPGETVLLVGENLNEGVSVEIARAEGRGGGLADLPASARAGWRSVELSNVDGRSLSFKVPQDLGFGAYMVRIHNGEGFTDPILLNAPDPWWVICDGGDEASPAGWVRVLGNALSFDGKSVIRVSSDSGEVFDLTPVRQDEYSLTASLPESIAEGRYSVSVRNGLGGDDLWRQAGSIEVKKPTSWGSDVINVVDFGADPTGVVDSTSAIKAALKAAEAKGGGVVFLPRGIFSVSDELVVPPYTVLKGEGKGLSNLDWRSRKEPLSSLIRGTDYFGLEDLVIYNEGDHNDIIVGGSHVTIRGLRIRSSAYFMFNSGLEPRRNWMVPLTRTLWDMGDAIVISGTDFQITDNDIYVTRNAIRLEHASYGVISGNKLRAGLSPVEMYGVNHVVFEDNEATGASYYSEGMGVGLDDSSVSSYDVYVGDNRFSRLFAASSGAKPTVGGCGTAYFGRIAEVEGLTVTLETALAPGDANDVAVGITCRSRGPLANGATEDWHGMTLYILAGKGAGQYCNVVEAQGRRLVIERPFRIEPDDTSVVSVGKFNGRHLFIGNEFTDTAVAVQLSAPSVESIIARNTLVRAGSIGTTGSVSDDGTSIQPSWYNQFVDNRVEDGLTWGDSGLPVKSGFVITGDNPSDDPFPISMGQVVRRNILGNDGFIKLGGSVTATVVENAGKK